jgi:hypothetical protein
MVMWRSAGVTCANCEKLPLDHGAEWLNSTPSGHSHRISAPPNSLKSVAPTTRAKFFDLCKAGV